MRQIVSYFVVLCLKANPKYDMGLDSSNIWKLPNPICLCFSDPFEETFIFLSYIFQIPFLCPLSDNQFMVRKLLSSLFSKRLEHLGDALFLLFHVRVNIEIKGCCNIGMTEQYAYGLVVAVAFNAACGKAVA